MKSLAKKIIGFKEFRTNASKYIAEIKKGESFLVMQKSTPIFKITPVDDWGDEGVWENVATFSNSRKKGLLIEDVIGKFSKAK